MLIDPDTDTKLKGKLTVAHNITSETIFAEQDKVAPLSIIALESARELGEKINAHLTEWAHKSGRTDDTFMVEAECPRFSSGDGKGIIKSSIRGDDLFILVDVGNYSCTYKMFGKENAMSPDDHFMDLKRIIQATSGKAHRINVIMPILYGGRQHRRNYRESLDCALCLQELAGMGVENLITFDAHDARVQNAIPLSGFENVHPTYQFLKAMVNNIPDIEFDRNHLMLISPDEGGMSRCMYYSSVLGVDLGMFYKRRDYSVIVNGRNPIVAHEFLGDNVAGKDLIIADDMISSGESVLDIAAQLKKMGARRIFVFASFGLFCEGLAKFDAAYERGEIDRVFTTNLIYRTPELLHREWYIPVDMSKYIAYIVDTLNHDQSISNLLNPVYRINKLLERKRAMEK